MKEYYIIDEIKNGDSFEEKCANQTEAGAIAEAKAIWEKLAEADKKRRATFDVALVEIDEDGCVDLMTGYTPLWSAK